MSCQPGLRVREGDNCEVNVVRIGFGIGDCQESLVTFIKGNKIIIANLC